MKKRILAMITAAAMVLTMVPAMTFAEATEPVPVVKINEENFPDDNFREKMLYYENHDDGVLYDYEIELIQSLDLSDEGISDLTGIQYLTSLRELYCKNNQLTSLDLSYLKELAYLDCSNNQLTNLNIWGCTSLCFLYAHHNNLETLDLDPTAPYQTIQLQYNDFISKSDIKLNGNPLDWNTEFAYQPQNSVQPVSVNDANFPDPVFRKILTPYDNNKDGMLSPEEMRWIYSLDFSNSTLEDLTGIHHLYNLETLWANSCYLTELPALPDSIKDLYVSYNYLTELPELPESLQRFWCVENQLTALPELPAGIKSVYCYDNEISTLPELPYGLVNLDCTRNQLTKLPALPDTLLTLSCAGNQLTQLPVLPDALSELWCNNNQLKSLPALPESLKTLYCYQNEITALPQLPQKIQSFDISVNKMGGVLDLSQQKFLLVAEAADNMFTGVKLSPAAKYERIDVCKNAMKSTADVTGRDDIVWDSGQFWFSDQKEPCELEGHAYKTITKKATFNMSGESVKKCTVCGETDYDSAVTYAIVKTPKNLTKVYTGKVLAAPKFVVKDSNGKVLKQGTDYSVKKVTSAKLKTVGKYKYKITLKGAKYSGYAFAYVTVNPKGTTINKLTKPAKKQIKVTWQKRTAQVTGYQIRYSTKQNMNGAKTVLVTKAKTNTKIIKKLKVKKKYWVQIRTYKTVSGKKYYSAWSAKKVVTTK